MTDLGQYLYCVVRYAEPRVFDSLQAIGGPSISVRTEPEGELAAIVSESPADKYECTRGNMLAHQRVLEYAMKEFTLLPVRFGTVAPAPKANARVHRLLDLRRDEFSRLLAEIDGKVEMGLKVLWKDEKAVFQEVLAENADIRRLRDSLQGRSPYAVRYEMMRLGELVKQALDRKRAAEAARLLTSLRPLECRTVQSAPTFDKMVLNVALLLESRKVPELDVIVNALDGEVGGRISLKYVGPTPPYNFVNITVNWDNASEEGQAA